MSGKWYQINNSLLQNGIPKFSASSLSDSDGVQWSGGETDNL